MIYRNLHRVVLEPTRQVAVLECRHIRVLPLGADVPSRMRCDTCIAMRPAQSARAAANQGGRGR